MSTWLNMIHINECICIKHQPLKYTIFTFFFLFFLRANSNILKFLCYIFSSFFSILKN